jgi:leucyl-tRNA synthetase
MRGFFVPGTRLDEEVMSENATPLGRVTSRDGGPDPELPFRYDARLANKIELAWQDRWEAEGTFNAPNPTGPLAAGFERVVGQPKFYVLDFFPYPSGAGLQVGNLLGYIGTDVYARFLRMTGHAVLHAMGYDAFGLPAEQYAINTGQHPAITTKINIDAMRGQLRRLGLGHDARREVATTDPRFYRWTQWIFLRIFNSWFDEDQGRARPISELIAGFEAGTRPASGPANPDGKPWAELDEVARRRVVDSWRLAYISEELVNWSPDLGTVLANEEVTADGRSDVGNYPVYRRPLRQWVLRITAYAERLLADLDRLDWPQSIKVLQRNWIGPSDGAIITFGVAGGSVGGATAGGGSVGGGSVGGATAGGATAGGATVAGPAGLRIEVFTTRPDTLPGATYLVLAPEHPLADALVADRWPPGTPRSWRFTEGQDDGAVHHGAVDDRAVDHGAVDHGAARHGVVDHGAIDHGAVDHGDDDGDDDADWSPADAVRAYRERTSMIGDRQRVTSRDKTGVFTGSYVINSATGEQIPVFLADYVLMGYGTGAIMAVPAHDERDLEFARSFGLPVTEVPGADDPADGRADDRIDAAIGWLERTGHGSRRRTYRLRDWLFSRQRYWGEPFPIVYDSYGLPVALPDEMLPVTLPEMTDFAARPTRCRRWPGPATGRTSSSTWATAPGPTGAS